MAAKLLLAGTLPGSKPNLRLPSAWAVAKIPRLLQITRHLQVSVCEMLICCYLCASSHLAARSILGIPATPPPPPNRACRTAELSHANCVRKRSSLQSYVCCTCSLSFKFATSTLQSCRSHTHCFRSIMCSLATVVYRAPLHYKRTCFEWLADIHCGFLVCMPEL